MKALTICQPYAELICRGDKRVENRTWPARFTGPLLIHAGKSKEWLSLNVAGDRDTSYDIEMRAMDFGAIVARAQLVDCLHIDRIQSGEYDERYSWLRDHQHTEGPWCWILASVERLARPIVWRGAQGLFDVPDHAIGAGPPPAGANQRGLF